MSTGLTVLVGALATTIAVAIKVVQANREELEMVIDWIDGMEDRLDG